MTIHVLELIRFLPLACGKERLHLLFWVQGQAAPSRSRTAGPTGTDLTVALRKLYFDERFACILDRCLARTDAALWTGDGLGFPIDGEVREVVASLCLIPMGLERRANQINSIDALALNKIGDGDIS